MTDLSVVIVNFNTKELVLKCLASIEKFGQGLNLEIIVVDNASTDGSLPALRKLGIGIISNSVNLGYAKANNQGIKLAKGKYILLLNSDAQVKEKSLEKLTAFAENHPEAGVVGSKLLNPDGSLQPSCFHFPTLVNAVREYWLGHKGSFEKYTPGGVEAREVDAVVGAVFLITPAAREKVGLLDERYWAYFEDLDYCREVWRKGLKVYYLPTAEVLHYHGASFDQLAGKGDQWKRLIPGSKIYHGLVNHYLINSVIWISQKCKNIFG